MTNHDESPFPPVGEAQQHLLATLGAGLLAEEAAEDADDFEDESEGPPCAREVVVVQQADGTFRRQRDEDAPPLGFVEQLHQLGTDGSAYAALAGARRRPNQQQLAETADDFIDLYLEQMQPRTPVERMLAVQMAWQHQRLANMVSTIASQTRVDTIKVLSAAIDRGMNVYRRQVKAWQELRATDAVPGPVEPEVQTEDRLPEPDGDNLRNGLPRDARDLALLNGRA